MDKLAEEEKRKWVAIHKTEGLTVRFDYGFMTRDAVEKSLQEWATKTGKSQGDVLLYGLGTEDEEQKGYLFFCPHCGSYNEYGMEPSTRMFYRRQEDGSHKPAGYFKSTWIECTNCDDTYEVCNEQYQKEADELTKLFFAGEENGGITN